MQGSILSRITPLDIVMPAKAGIHLSFVKAVAMRQKGGWVYIMTNRQNGTLYVGVTSNLIRQTSQRRAGEIEGFTQRYGLKMLVHFERYEDIVSAITRKGY